MSDIDVTLKATAECIKQANNFGHTVYYNICTGESTTMPWGSFDIFLGCFMVGGITALIATFIMDMRR